MLALFGLASFYMVRKRLFGIAGGKLRLKFAEVREMARNRVENGQYGRAERTPKA